ncbi:MAG: septum formation initiator family protein [Verrucomicrobia bacterium]|nr:septum formation initiator family protein [Verrucomicrobiota bacterium]
MNSRRAITALYAVLLGLFGLGGGMLFLEARAEQAELRNRQARLERELAAAKSRLAEQEQFLSRLRTDPVLAEKVIRQRLGYGRPGEVVFRFDNGP